MLKKQKTQRNGERAPGLSAGYANSVITPGRKGVIPIVSMQDQKVPINIHDDLWVRALAIKSNRTACKVIISCDLIGLDYQSCQQVRTLINDEVPRAEIILACSTTRHGPDCFGTQGLDYLNWLIDNIAQTALKALALLSPVVFRSVSFNRSELNTDLDNPADQQATFQVLQLADRLLYTPKAILVRMDHFPRTILPEGEMISADFSGFLNAALSRLDCGPLVFLPGAQPKLPHLQDWKSDFTETLATSAQIATKINAKISKSEWQIDPQLVFASAWFEYASHKDDKVLKTSHSRVTLIRIGKLLMATVPVECSMEFSKQLTNQMSNAQSKVAGVICQVDDALDLSPQLSADYETNPGYIEHIKKAIADTLNMLFKAHMN